MSLILVKILKPIVELSSRLAEQLAHTPEFSDRDERRASAGLLTFSLILVKLCETRRPNALSSLFVGTSSTNLNFKEIIEIFGRYDRVFSTTLFCPAQFLNLELNSESLAGLIADLRSLPDLGSEALPFVYEKLLCSTEQKKEGIFYTPLPVVNRIIKNSLDAWLDLHSDQSDRLPTIFDPACGSGVFLLAAYRQLLERFPRYSESLSGRYELLCRTIFGVDKDRRAVEVTKLTLTLALLEQKQQELFGSFEASDFEQNIFVGNALLDKEHFNPEEVSLSENCLVRPWPERAQRARQGGFDCIIGNPPYGLSRGNQIEIQEKEKLERIYASFISGKLNKYLLFMARGYELLAPEGILSFIVPNSWLGISNGLALRKKLLEDAAIESLVVYDLPVFDTPSVEAVIVKIRKGVRSKHILISHLSELDPKVEPARCLVPLKACLSNPDLVIPLNWSPEAQTILEKIARNSFELDSPHSPFLPLIAMQAYAEGKGDPPQSALDVKNHVFHSHVREDQFSQPYLEGKDIGRYSLHWSGGYLKYGPWLAEPQTLDRFAGARILLREIIGSKPYLFSATYTEELYLYNKSVLHILPKEGVSKEQLLALLAILNSKLASFILSYRGRKSQRKIFPKIVNQDLKTFPVHRSFNSRLTELAKLATELLAHPADLALSQTVDNYVYALYELGEKEIALLEEELKIQNSQLPPPQAKQKPKQSSSLENPLP